MPALALALPRRDSAPERIDLPPLALVARSGARSLREELDDLYRDLANEWLKKEATRRGIRDEAARKLFFERNFQHEYERIRGYGPHMPAERQAIDAAKSGRFSRITLPALGSGIFAYDAISRTLALVNGRNPGIAPGVNVLGTGIKRTFSGPASAPAAAGNAAAAGR